MNSAQVTRVLFVCLGNICRSPLAEGLFRHKVEARGLTEQFHVDSAGTGDWHIGHPPDERMLETALGRGVQLTSRARQVRKSDFVEFDVIYAMDRANQRDLLELGAPDEKVKLFLKSDPKAEVIEVPDPYFGGLEGFHEVFDLVDRACEAILEEYEQS